MNQCIWCKNEQILSEDLTKNKESFCSEICKDKYYISRNKKLDLFFSAMKMVKREKLSGWWKMSYNIIVAIFLIFTFFISIIFPNAKDLAFTIALIIDFMFLNWLHWLLRIYQLKRKSGYRSGFFF